MAESRTDKESSFVDNLVGTHHYKTTISEENKKVEGRGTTPEEAQRIASEKWKYKIDVEDTDGCYITTACIETKGLPDNCLELTVLREFRDKYIKKLPNGKEIIDEYYKTTPKIVEKINKTPNSKEIYSKLYDKILDSVNMIKSGKFHEAFKHYYSIVDDLKNRFL